MLREQLGTLPAPKNDYEILIPDEEEGGDEVSEKKQLEDREDVEKRQATETQKRRVAEFRKMSQAVQRDLPRPTDVNSTMLRTAGYDQLNGLQKVRHMFSRYFLYFPRV